MSWESEPIDSISDVTVASGDFQYFVLEWEIPENWEDEKSQFVVEITDGTYTAYDAYPWYIAPSYNPGDILLSDVSIDLADRDDIQFVGNEKRKSHTRPSGENGYIRFLADCP